MIDNYVMDSTKDYTDSVSFDVDHWEELPVVTGLDIGNILLFVVIATFGLAGIIVVILLRRRKAEEGEE